MLKLSINTMDEYSMSKQCYVYWYHLNETDDKYFKGYVGITTNLKERHWHHKTGRTNNHLANAFNKYGETAIIKTILLTGTVEECLQLEIKLRATANIGWNIEPGGGVAPDCSGRIHSQETKDKIGKGNKGKNAGKVSPFKGITGRYTKETRALIGSYHKGKTITVMHRKAISDKNSGVNHHRSKPIQLIHIDNPEVIKIFVNMREAAQQLNLNYPSLRDQKRSGRTTFNRKGWKILR